MDLDLRYTDLHACASCLGFTEDNEYKKDLDAEASLKDILRYLRRENANCDIRRELGKLKLVSSDLIPMLRSYHHIESLFDLVIRLLMNLTQPAIICFRQELPKDREMRGHYIQVDDMLKEYKLAFADAELMKILSGKVGELFDKEWEERSEEDRLLIERILILMRNVLHISPDPNQEQRTDEDVSMHDQVLWAMHGGGWDDILLFLANSDDEQSFAFHTLEIISLMFREQTPEVLSNAGKQTSNHVNDPSLKILERAKLQEEEGKRQELQQMNIRQNRFGGTFELRGVQSLSSRPLIYHHDVTAQEVSMDRDKQPHRKPKNRRPVKEREVVRRSTLSIRLHLQSFCWKFLQFCYNPLMRTAKSFLVRQSTQADDETYYLWAMRFFMAFCRLYKFSVDLISETVNVQVIHWVYEQVMTYFENIRMDKAKSVQWSRRLQLGMAAYKELLNVLHTMGNSPEEAVRHSAQTIKANVFYMVEYREIYPLLLRSFDETKQSRSYLRDLVEGAHLLVKMLQQQAKSGLLVVKKKGKGRAKRKKTKKVVQPPPQEPTGKTREELDAAWDVMSDMLSAGIQGEVELPGSEDLPVLFDPTREEGASAEDQMKAAIVHIRESLHSNQPLRALALLKTAKDLWPEEAVFAVEQDYLALREIHFTEVDAAYLPTEDQPVEDEEVDGEEDEEAAVLAEMRDGGRSSEAVFDIKEYTLRFAHPDVVHAYSILLSEYVNNSEHSNHCILRMLHRLVVEQKMPSLLYQLRLLRVFQKFFKDPLSNTSEFKELRKFGVYVMRKFFEHCKANDKLFVEILFYKSIKEGMETIHGYGMYEEKSKKLTWSPELDTELERLYDEYNGQELPPGKDLCDVVQDNFSDVTKTRRQIVVRMVYLNLISSAKDLRKRPMKLNEPREWTEEELDLLRRLVEENSQTKDLLGAVRVNLLVPRSKQSVRNKILELGLVDDPSRLGKRRRRGGEGAGGPSRKRRRTDEEGGVDDERNHRIISEEFVNSSEDSSSSDEEDYNPLEALLEEAETSFTGPRVSTADSGGQTSVRREKKKKEAVNRKEQREVRTKKMNFTEITRLVKDVTEECLSWLKEQLEWAVDDRSSGVHEPIPLVAITTDLAEALDLPATRALLTEMGLRPPDADQGERYWRIPADLDADALKRIEGAMKGEETAVVSGIEEDQPPSAEVAEGSDMASSTREDKEDSGSDSDSSLSDIDDSVIVPQRRKKLDVSARSDMMYDSDKDSEDEDASVIVTKKKKKLDVSTRSDSDKDSEDEDASVIVTKRRKKLDVSTRSDSDKDSEDEVADMHDESPVSGTPVQEDVTHEKKSSASGQRRKLRIIDSDDDDEEVVADRRTTSFTDTPNDSDVESERKSSNKKSKRLLVESESDDE